MTDLASRLRLYVITAAMDGRSHDDVALAAIRGGADAVQLRAPELEDAELLIVAHRLAVRCHETGTLFIVNDRPEVAAQVGADGVHVGQGDDFAGARARLHEGQLLGISTRGVGDLDAALDAGADYVAVTVWPTATKPQARAGGLAAVRELAERSPVPVVGIGGITAANAGQVRTAGAAGVAVISAVAAAVDPVAATRELAAAVQDTQERLS